MTRKSETTKPGSKIRKPKNPSASSSHRSPTDIPDKANDYAEIIAQLRAEIEDLRKRLKKSEENLRAVQNGNTLPLVSSSVRDQVSAYESPVSIRDREATLEVQVAERNSELLFHQVELQMQNEQLRAAQEDLESSRTKYAELYEFAPVGYFTLDIHGVIRELNVTGANLLGYDKRSLIDKPFSNFIRGEDDRRNFSSHRRKTFIEQGGLTCEVLLMRKNETVFHAQLQSAAVENVDCKAGCIRTTVIDVTERKQAEEALRESEARYRSLIELSPEGVVVHADGKFVYLNPVALKLCGAADAGKIIGKPVLDFIQPEEREAIEKRITECYEYKVQTPVRETKLLRLDGQTVDVETSGAPVTYQGKAAMQVLIHDITERKRAEAALRESEERFRKIFEEGPLGMVLNGLDFRFIKANDHFCRLIGYSEEELSKLSPFDITHPDDIDTGKELAGRVLLGELPYFTIEKRYIRKDNSKVWITLTATIIRAQDGNPLYFLGMVNDITERKRAEEKLHKENCEIALANRILEVFVKEAGDDMFDKALSILLEGMESKHGVFGYIDEQGDLICPTMSKLFDKCEITGKCICYTREKWKGLWSRALLEQKTLFSNKPAVVPSGHVAIQNNMAAPILFHGNVIGLFNLANKDTDYTEEDREFIEAISNRIAPVLFAWIQKELRENERKRAEEEISRLNQDLQRRVSELETIFKTVPIGLSIAEDPQGRHIRGNPATERLLGVPAGSELSRKGKKSAGFRALQDGHELPVEELPMQRAVRGEMVSGQIIDVVRDDGRIVKLLCSATPLFDERGRPRGAVGAFLEITELKLAEEKLLKLNEDLETRVQERTEDLAKTITALQGEVDDRRRAEQALSEIRDNLKKAQAVAHIGSWSYDLRSKKVAWSDELYRIVGMTPGAINGNIEKIILRVVHPDDLEKVRKAYQQMLTTSKAMPLEYRIILPDGTNRVVWAEADMILDKAGKQVSIVGTVQDITERKCAEEELTRLATAIESAADALVVTDPVKGIINYVNPAFERITGFSRDEVVGQDLHMLDSGRHDDAFYQKLRETLHREGSWTGRMVHKKKDGTLYEEECTYSPVKNAAGEIINYISIKRDVTEKTRLESIAQAVDTMNNIGYIFSGVSHEIGNPINSIGMVLDIMKKKLNVLRAEQMKEFLDRVITDVKKVQYLLTGLKNFNMYENLQPRSIEVASFLDAFLSIVRKDFEEKGVMIQSVVEPNADCLYADPRALQQVLLNVFTNALDAMDGRQNPQIELCISESGGIVKLRVRDNGKGIEESRLKDLFKPFYTTKKHGTGLGLVIIKKMLARMNGTVEIASRVNEGTVVEIAVPSRIPMSR